MPVPAGCDTPGADSSHLPRECLAIVWRCLPLVERMSASTASSASRRAAPAAVRLVGSAQRLCVRLHGGHKGTHELWKLEELVVVERGALSHQVPAVLDLICGLLRCPHACVSTRRCAAQCLGSLLGSAQRARELFAEHDCGEDGGPAVLEPALGALAWAAAQDALRPAALDALVGAARAIAAGVREAGGPVVPRGRWAAAWGERQRWRAEARDAASAFNRDPQAWLDNLRRDEGSYINSEAEQQAGAGPDIRAARFLSDDGRGAPLDSAKVGELFARNEGVMTAFIEQFDLRGLDIVAAFKRVLRRVRVCGEAQQVDRFCECFGAAWGEANGIDTEVAYIFAYSLVMLSTDLHSPANVGRVGRERMTLQEYERSLASALPEGSLPECMVHNAYEQLRLGALLPTKKDEQEEDLVEVCSRLRRAVCHCSAGAAPREDGGGGSDDLAGVWQALWSVAWGPLLGALSAGAHAAGEDDSLREVALRGLQLGCEAAALLEEAEQAQAFSAALRQLSSSSF